MRTHSAITLTRMYRWMEPSHRPGPNPTSCSSCNICLRRRRRRQDKDATSTTWWCYALTYQGPKSGTDDLNPERGEIETNLVAWYFEVDQVAELGHDRKTMIPTRWQSRKVCRLYTMATEWNSDDGSWVFNRGTGKDGGGGFQKWARYISTQINF